MANETYETEGIRCPHCGYLDRDAWEWESDQSDCTEDWECGNCMETSSVTRYTSVSYAAEVKTDEP